MVAHADNSSTWEAEAEGCLSLSTSWFTLWFPEQPELHSETLSLAKTEQQTSEY